MTMQSRLSDLGLNYPTILLPKPDLDLQRWAVIACDQFTSDQGYWEAVEQYVGDSPSTLHVVLPEIYLDQRDQEVETRRIRTTMEEYLQQDVFQEYSESAVFVTRTLSDGTERRGLVLAVDLESYDYNPDTAALIRASEETIPSRLPPRAAIRKEALLETPHVLVLYNDPDDTVTGILSEAEKSLDLLYDTPLMMDGGGVRGRRVPLDHPATAKIVSALEALRDGSLLFATGDGNHSLAAAKTVWQERKAAGAAENDPFRYCLVELVNVFDPGLPFHPIHRLARGAESTVLELLEEKAGSLLQPLSRSEFVRSEETSHPGKREIGFYGPDSAGKIAVTDKTLLPVALVDDVLSDAPVSEIDYVHGFEEVCRAADRVGGAALIVPEFDRDKLFPTVATRGALPRKAFSLGRAVDKRYYLECRALT